MFGISQLRQLWSGRLSAAAAARQLTEQLSKLMPDTPWKVDDRRPGSSSLTLSDRLVVVLEDGSDGLEARVVEPGQPGEDDPPIPLRAAYDVTNLAHSLSWRARVAPGTVVLHAMRASAVYEVVEDFSDHNGRAYTAGTRLTFVERKFLPYDGGHTLRFREATVYLQEDSEVCRAFERFFAFAKPQ